MKNHFSRQVSLVIVLTLILSILAPAGLATENNLLFVFPAETYGEDPNVTVDLYLGVPTATRSRENIEREIEEGKLQLIQANAQEGCPMPEQAGTYCYHVYGLGYYDVYKLVNITEDDIKANTKTINVHGGKIAGNGYEPYLRPETSPVTEWTDEILEHFTLDNQNYQTPAFRGEDAEHEFTTQEEMMAFVKERTEACPYMYLYSAGKTPNFRFDIPIVLITTSELPEGATLEEAAKVLTADGKVNIWYQSQIHGNEQSGSEAALVMIDNFINDEQYKKFLDTTNIIVVPRVNPEGSYLCTRTTFGDFDMNRDHMVLKATELALLHKAWGLFETEVALDGHEFTYYSYDAKAGQMRHADDIQTTPASSLNNDSTLNSMALDMTGYAFSAAKDANLRVNHYGWTANPPIGRTYFGLLNCLSFLIEIRGINNGRGNYERRVYSHEVVTTAYIEYVAAHAKEIKEAVAKAREKLIASGKTYDDANKFALYQTASGNTLSPYVCDSITYKLDGTEVILEKDDALEMNDTMERSRVRPTAYVIPADHENIKRILYIMDYQGAEYFELAAEEPIELQQYYYVGPYVDKDGKDKGFAADVRGQAMVSFENGAYIIPMDQLPANVIASICEPDVNDSNGYDGTLVQFGLMTHDPETGNYPIYRYIGDNPREMAK